MDPDEVFDDAYWARVAQGDQAPGDWLDDLPSFDDVVLRFRTLPQVQVQLPPNLPTFSFSISPQEHPELVWDLDRLRSNLLPTFESGRVRITPSTS